MSGPSPSDVEVTQEDQHKINAFGRLNVRMHELKNAITTTQVGSLCRWKAAVCTGRISAGLSVQVQKSTCILPSSPAGQAYLPADSQCVCCTGRD